MRIFDNRDQFMIINAIASETTAATFVSTASNGEGTLLQEDGQAAAGAGDTFRAVSKNSNGAIVKSPFIVPGNIKAYAKTSPVTALPEYSNFTVSATGLAAGDHYEVFVRTYGLGSESTMDTYEKVVFHNYVAGDTALTIAEDLCAKLYQSFASFFRTKERKVHNKAGYVAVYTTQAAALAAKAALDNGDLIWVMETGLPYTVVDDTAVTFATLATAKTDWSTEIAAGTAEYVPATKYWEFITTTAGIIYVTAIPADRLDDKFDGVNCVTRVAAATWDYSNQYKTSDVTVTYTNEVINPTSGKRLRSKEVSLDKDNRQYGKFAVEEYEPTFDVVATTDYYVVDIQYLAAQNEGDHTNVKQNKVFNLTIACDDDTTASSIISSLGTIIG